MGFLIKIILVVILIYLLFKALFKGLIYYLFGKATKNFNDQINRQQEEMIRQSKKQQGRVTVDYQPGSSKNIGKEEGDYIDFEEVK